MARHLDTILVDLFITNMQLFMPRVNWWTGVVVDYWDVFISCLNAHSDGIHSLQMIQWSNLFWCRNKHLRNILVDLGVSEFRMNLNTIAHHISVWPVFIVTAHTTDLINWIHHAVKEIILNHQFAKRMNVTIHLQVVGDCSIHWYFQRLI